MKNINEESGKIASLALFKELYDSEKDIYGVIACFLQEIIVVNAKHAFNLHEITNLLNDTFNFHIPEGVVKTSLGRLSNFLEKNEGGYCANLSNIDSPSLIPKKDEIIKNNSEIIEHIIKFISSKTKRNIEDSDREEIIHSFCSFLLDKTSSQEYSEYISAFIIANQNNPDFINRLKCIKEGVVLYTGIMFTDNINNIGSWNTELTIFLDTEILFDFAGYNTELYKSLFHEFHSFVKEINHKASKPLIKLRYFSKVKDNIHSYFSKAEYILSGNEIVNPGRPAMNHILNGSKSVSDIVEKKTLFFNILDENDILMEDDYDYYCEENQKYNITFHKDEEKKEQEIADLMGVETIKDNLELLNFIRIRRAEESNNNFEHIGNILLTGNNTTLQLAWCDKIRNSGEVPLATSLHFLTDKFWFKLNKGFGINTFPRVFDVITKAQLLLSSQLNKSVGNKFDELQKRFKEGKLNEKQVALTIVNLRNQAKGPEEIIDDNISFVLDSLSENNLDKIIEEQEHFKNKAQKLEQENIELKIEVEKFGALLERQKIERENNKDKHFSSVSKIKKDLLAEKKKNLAHLEIIKTKIDKKIEWNIFLWYKTLPSIIVIIYYILLSYCIYRFGWNIMEPISYLLALLPPIAFIIISLFQEKTCNPWQWLNKRKEKVREMKYKKEVFNLKEYDSLKEDIDLKSIGQIK